MDLSIRVILSLFSGVTSAYAAHKKGQNPYFWLLIGLALGAFGVFAFLFIPNTKKVARRRRTAPKQQYLVGPIDRFWYYVDEAGNPAGPMSHTALSRALREGKINPETLVWHDQMKDWKKAKTFLA